MASFEFPNGTLVLTEAGTSRRASMYVAQGEADLPAHDPGGIDVLAATTDRFAAALRRENHTLKRSLTDPRLFSGIGNAYSDEILLAARLSPLQLTSRLTDEEMARLRNADSAHSRCRQRGRLLPNVPDGRQVAGRPRALAAAQGRLAEVTGRVGEV